MIEEERYSDISEELVNETPLRQNRFFKPILIGSGIVLIIAIFAIGKLFTLNDPPKDFPTGEPIVVEEGTSTARIASSLESQGVIRSSLYMRYLFKTEYQDSYIQAGVYSFPERLSNSEVLDALISGAYSLPEDVATFPEGFRIADMHKYLPLRFKDESLKPYQTYEGYLFPDTYFIGKEDTLSDIIDLMRTTFDTRIQELQEEIDTSLLSLDEIIILASILEREANDEISMRTVAGILLTRLEIGMALQVDATFEYLLGKGSHELTEEDLEIDSPYNTYTNRGLPPTPIANPGLMAMRAVLDPIKTDYLYYLSDEDGVFHYSETFEEHKENKIRYLR
jgi:UPF0755 protein